MKSIASELDQSISHYMKMLNLLDETKASIKPAPNKWSKKEILGHLADSAQNNLRRFIVAQHEDNPRIVYRQDDWVKMNDYQNTSLMDIRQLWYLLNRQIVTVLSNTDDEAAQRKCETGEIHTIKWLASDYIKHLKHHLHQILDLEEVAYP